MRRNADADILSRCLGVFDEHVEVAVIVEDACIHQLELRRAPAAAEVFLHQPGVRKLRLRVLVEELHVGVSGGRVEIEVILFHVFPVVPFTARQAEDSLLEDRVAAIP